MEQLEQINTGVDNQHNEAGEEVKLNTKHKRQNNKIRKSGAITIREIKTELTQGSDTGGKSRNY